MITHAWTVACNKCIVDPSTNNATLVEVLEQISVTGLVQFPAVAPLQVDVVTVWYRSDPARGERGTGRFRLVNPDGSSTAETEYAIDLTNHFRARSIGRLAGLPIAGPGSYFFQVELREDQRWREVARIPFFVAHTEVPQAAQVL
jgi:hypothetical protein